MKGYTTADVRRMKEMATHYPPEQIASELGRTKAAIIVFACRNGIPLTNRRYEKRTSKQRNNVQALRRAGKTYREIVEETGIPISTCIRWGREAE
ncbi:hypothetical protein [Mixta sp. Marseille-Q2659]|uniref:hypothetical protein n=1 Tax=Mixta sp. Marseille-Q2659 TaxID=2736607 RepID=UPI0023BA3ADF|nr:hypothetical protein [Mixta sp. Marseille-Q2659]